MDHPDPDGLRAASRSFAFAATGMLALLLLIVVGTLIDRWSDPAGLQAETMALDAALDLLPIPFYLWAVFAVRRTFSDIGRGALFEPTVTRGLRQLGCALLGSGLASTLVVPVLSVAILRPAAASGAPPEGRYADQVDAAHVMLIILGVAILLVARLCKIAAAYRARAIELEIELREFP